MIEEQTNYQYHIGLSLSGGGAKGYAHIGVLQFLEQCKIKPEIISGTSAGSLIGAFYADGYSPTEICQLFSERHFDDFTDIQIPRAGIFDTSKFKAFLEANLRAKTFEELDIPLIVVATDLDNGESHNFTSGKLANAIVASCSIPIVFNPIEINGIHYVDGGLFRNFPVSEIRDKCERVIGVNVSPLIPKEYKQTLLNIAERSYHYMFRANTLEDRELCDILIETEEFGMYKTFDIEKMYEIVQLGYEAATVSFKHYINEKPNNSIISSQYLQNK